MLVVGARLTRLVPTLPFLEFHHNLFSLNQSFMNQLRKQDQTCGYADFREKYMTFPPPGKLPTPPHVNTKDACDIFDNAINAATLINDMSSAVGRARLPWLDTLYTSRCAKDLL